MTERVTYERRKAMTIAELRAQRKRMRKELVALAGMRDAELVVLGASWEMLRLAVDLLAARTGRTRAQVYDVLKAALEGAQATEKAA